MINIFVSIYSDEELTLVVGSYNLNFIAVPRVGDYISKHRLIEGSFDCRVKEVAFIPKLENSTDADIFLKCVQTNKRVLD